MRDFAAPTEHSDDAYRRGLLTLDYRPFCTTDPVTPRGSYVGRPRVRVHALPL